MTDVSPSCLVLWFCGLSGAGKSTVASDAAARLSAGGERVLVLDGDAVRENFHRTLGFTEPDILENNRLISELCVRRSTEHDVILVPIISPLDRARKAARSRIGASFRLIWCRAGLDTVVRRDVKGLYAQAREGRIRDLIGYSRDGVAFEDPDDADLVLETGSETQQRSVDALLRFVASVRGETGVPGAAANGRET